MTQENGTIRKIKLNNRIHGKQERVAPVNDQLGAWVVQQERSLRTNQETENESYLHFGPLPYNTSFQLFSQWSPRHDPFELG